MASESERVAVLAQKLEDHEKACEAMWAVNATYLASLSKRLWWLITLLIGALGSAVYLLASKAWGQ